MVAGKNGLYQQINIQKKPLTIKQFAELANTERYATPKHLDYDHLEREYWDNITDIAPIYGADVSGSITDPECKEWNINHLNTILDYVNRDYGIQIDGVNTAYLYFGKAIKISVFVVCVIDRFFYLKECGRRPSAGTQKTWICIR